MPMSENTIKRTIELAYIEKEDRPYWINKGYIKGLKAAGAINNDMYMRLVRYNYDFDRSIERT